MGMTRTKLGEANCLIGYYPYPQLYSITEVAGSRRQKSNAVNIFPYLLDLAH
jgi:hypothetical protein